MFHYHPSAGRDELEFTKQRQDLRAHVVLERRVNEDQVERLALALEFAERATHVGHDHAGAVAQFKPGKIGANRGGGVAR